MFTLRLIEYEEERNKIICAINASEEEWDRVLMQQERDEKHHHIIHYESRLWLKVKKKYDVKKHECYDILKMFKKCQKYLYEIQFILKIDTNTLITQLNKMTSNLSEALITH